MNEVSRQLLRDRFLLRMNGAPLKVLTTDGVHVIQILVWNDLYVDWLESYLIAELENEGKL